ncbi:MAG: glucose dehydrogenase [Pseudonocardiaceae bacterium]|nr:glucose dehydrogenase [Pseudonocardiaceae bacterium]
MSLLVGCAALPDFPEQGSGQWRPKPEIGPQAGPQPQVPNAPGLPGTPQEPGSPQGSPPSPPGPPRGCDDPDPAVVATCLEPITAIAVLPGGRSALVAERGGRILRVEKGVDPVEVASVQVDAAGEAGLSGLALSPSYGEDELIFAYVTTASENRVLRIAPGDEPKPVLAGIPRGSSGNSGALGIDGTGALMVATGDAGDPRSATDPASLAGKVLRIDTSGEAADDNPDPASRVVAAGLHAPTGMCSGAVAGSTWITDDDGDRDLLHRVVPGQPLGEPEWVWPERPGASGCTVMQGRAQVPLADTASIFALGLGPDGSFVGQPQTVPLPRYGRISAAAAGGGGVVWLGTSNTDGGKPISSDERVLRLPNIVGGGGGRD